MTGRQEQGPQDQALSEDDLLRAGLERLVSTAVDGGQLYDDLRQEVEHVMQRDEAESLARRRLGLPRLPRHMQREELLALVAAQQAEIKRLAADVEQARQLVLTFGPDLGPRSGLYELQEKAEYYWLDDLP